MSRRVTGAAPADSRPNGPSRRQLIVSSATAATVLPAGLTGDPAIQACRAWQACQAEYEDLIKRWQTLEAYLIHNHDWCRLSRRQRAAMPEAFELDAIDDLRDMVFDHKQQLLMALPHISATTPRGLAAKLAVAASVIHRHENAEGHELISSVLRDLRNMAGGLLE
jgi:hypothetical protein